MSKFGADKKLKSLIRHPPLFSGVLSRLERIYLFENSAVRAGQAKS